MPQKLNHSPCGETSSKYRCVAAPQNRIPHCRPNELWRMLTVSVPASMEGPETVTRGAYM